MPEAKQPTTAACQGTHPEVGLANVNITLCQPCYGRGIRCPSHHALDFKAAKYTTCNRDLGTPATLVCDACKKTMSQEVYLRKSSLAGTVT